LSQLFFLSKIFGGVQSFGLLQFLELLLKSLLFVSVGINGNGVNHVFGAIPATSVDFAAT
jgi:hypothetical protein